MKTFVPIFALVVMLLSAGDAHAQFQLGVRGGYDLETEDPLLGVEARFGLNNPSFPLIIAPAFDYYFLDSDRVNFYALDLNLLYPFGINNRSFTPYAGAGLGVGFTSVDVGRDTESDTDLGVNLVGGAVFGFSRLRPFIQARLKLGGDADLATLHGGVLHSL